MSMFCFQCQETANGIGCTISGVCGKNESVANMQDLLIYNVKGLSWLMHQAFESGIDISEKYDRLLLNSIFATITNANFDRAAIIKLVNDVLTAKKEIFVLVLPNIENTSIPDAAIWAENESKFDQKSLTVGITSETHEDISSLKELIMYGIKGLSAYVEHAWHLNYKDKSIITFVANALSKTLCKEITIDELVGLTMKVGENSVKAMALLDKANTETYGNPEITSVKTGTRNNPAILISGHDLRDIEDLLEQTKGTGVDVYTHSEMLPAHYYPKFKKYDNLVGNYGSSWWKQVDDFETFNGPFLFTTNCIVPPKANASYTDRIYTTGSAGFTGSVHIADRKEGGRKDFSQIIEHAKRCNPPTQIEDGNIIGGFAHAQVIALADKFVGAVKSGTIRKFVVMAGCDGRMKSRDYYTEFAKNLPNDTVILTAGCAKYRYNKLPLGDIGGIPRILDAGQCNDSYSLAVIALKLKEVFGLDNVNKLPIVYNIAWYEQKAVAVLLALLSLGVKNIHLGPTLPGFLSANVIKILVDNFGIDGIANVDEDLKKMIV